MIILAKTLATAKVSVSLLMHASTNLRSLTEHQGNHHKRAIVPIQHRDVSSVQRFHDRSQETRFTGPLAGTGANGQVHHRRRRL